MKSGLPMGPLMIDVDGHELSVEDRELLAHPLVGGLILFTRNYASTEQVAALVADIRAARRGDLLIAVDYEGGRVQRFREGVSQIPSMGLLGDGYSNENTNAQHAAFDCGWLLATELRALDIDLAFAPVVDLDFGVSEVIGDRSFHRDPAIVATLAGALMQGMRNAGMAATAKHFPGHGAVAPDSHAELPVDDRSFEQIAADDLAPFRVLSQLGLDSVMMAHILYPEIDEMPAGFSRRWIEDILRRDLAFDGVVFSDDLSMGGAAGYGDYADRAKLAMDAGCDMAIICNNRAGAVEAIDGLGSASYPEASQRLTKLMGEPDVPGWSELADNEQWRSVSARVAQLVELS